MSDRGDPAATALADLELGRVLGRGVSGRVLRVRDRRTAATYALKTIEKSHIKGEAQLATQLTSTPRGLR